MLFQPHQTLLFVGASVTDCGRERPGGEGSSGALGSGYVSLVDSLIAAAYPAHGLRVLNRGVSGNTTRDLTTRWQADVLDAKPEWVSVLLPTNDVGRQFDKPRQTETHVLPKEYEANLDAMAQTRPAFSGGLIFMAPFYLEPNPNEPMRAMMDAYGAMVRRVAAQHDLLFVDTQAAFAPLLSHNHPSAIASDRVHPNQTGHVVIARAFLQAIGFEWMPK